MSKFLSEYGKALLYVFVAMAIVIPLLVILLNGGFGGLLEDQNDIVYKDNSYIKVYDPPKVTAATNVIRVDKSSPYPDLISLFSVKATVDINGEEKQVDSSSINIDTDLNTEKEGMYLVTFKTTYVYTTEDGVNLPRDGMLTTRVLVE